MTADVFIAIPCYGGKIGAGILTSLLSSSNPKRGIHKTIKPLGFSVLTRNFNILYCCALNSRASGTTHFLMLHEDIEPEPLWLDKMLDLMEKHDADILSVVSPIKNRQGFTTTALDEPLGDADPTWRVRRLTLTELHEDFPPTFTHPKLLINTGLMLVKLTEPWCEKLHFHFTDGIIKNAKGNFVPVGVSEDWNFSRQANALGLKIFATREVKLLHHGQGIFTNEKWGTEKKDALEEDSPWR